MHPGEEDLYITVVVLRRPASGDSADLDPNMLAQSVVEGIRAQEGMYGRSLSGRAWPRWAESLGEGRGRTAGWHNRAPRQPVKRNWFLLAVAVACWTGAALCAFMLIKQGL